MGNTGVSHAAGRSLVISRLPAGLDEADVHELFDTEGYGTIVSAKYEPEKGWGVVQYSSEQEAHLAASRMDERWYSGCQLAVRLASSLPGGGGYDAAGRPQWKPSLVLLLAVLGVLFRLSARQHRGRTGVCGGCVGPPAGLHRSPALLLFIAAAVGRAAGLQVTRAQGDDLAATCLAANVVTPEPQGDGLAVGLREEVRAAPRGVGQGRFPPVRPGA